MKLTPEHVAHITEAIQALPAATRHRIVHRQPCVTNARRAADPYGGARVAASADMYARLGWDLLYAAGLEPWLCHEVYPYADDTHITTALRRIAAKVAEDDALANPRNGGVTCER